MKTFYLGLFGSQSIYVDCDTCEIAWLYKDARSFGLPFYKNVLGLGNVWCRSGTNVLEPNPTMAQFFEQCPSNSIFFFNFLTSNTQM